MSTPNPQIYCFEDELEKSVCAWLVENGINDPKKQRSNDNLLTPTVEVRFLFNGFVSEHYWINQTTKERWLDLGAGTLYLKVVTRRDDADQVHAKIRGTCRWLMQNRDKISGKMTLHRVDKIVEQASGVTFDNASKHDISSLSFAINMSILPAAFPQT